jgi:hypothetical protein
MRAIAEHAPTAWVMWRRGEVDLKTGKFKKIPCHLDGKYIKGDEGRHTRYSLQNVFRMARAGGMYSDGRGGVGVYLRAPLFGIDLDDVVSYDDDGQPVYTDSAKAIMAQFPTYTEISPTGTGIKLFLLHGDDAGGSFTNTLPDDGSIEVYPGEGTRYFTVTGHPVTGTPTTLYKATTDDIATLYAQYKKSATPPSDDVATSSTITPPLATTTTPGTDDTYIQMRVRKWIAKSWPKIVEKAEKAVHDGTSSTDTDSYHNARLKNGHALGASLRGVEYLCKMVDLAPTNTIPTPNTKADLVAALYEAKKPEGSPKTKADEYKTIVDGVEQGYDKATSWRNIDGQTLSLRNLAHAIENTPPLVTKATHNASSTLSADNATPSSTTAPPVTSGGEYLFDDIIQPRKEAIEALNALITATGGKLEAHNLYSTAADIAEMADTSPQPVIACVENNQHLLMPGVCQLAAGSKAGKSTIALHFAYCVATGADEVFGTKKYHVPHGGRVVYFDLENDPGITGRRMADSFATMPELLTIVPPDQWHSVVGAAMARKVDRWQAMQWYISDALRRWPDTKLLILDNVLQFQPRRSQHETPEDLEQRYMMWLANVASERTGMCIMLVDHNTKAQATDNETIMMHKAQGTFRKQALLNGGVLTVYTAPKKDNAPENALKLATTMRACENTAIILTRDDTRGHHVVLDVERLPLTVVQRRVYEAIRSGCTTFDAICKALPDMAKNYVHNTASQLAAKGVITRPKHGTYGITDDTYNTRALPPPPTQEEF